MPRLGVHFGGELIASGLSEGLAFRLEDGFIFGRETLTAGQQAQLDALITTHDPDAAPASAKSWTPLQFMELFTPEERATLRQFARNDAMAEDWLDLLKASMAVRVNDPRTIAGLNYMVLKGILSQGRVDEVLSSTASQIEASHISGSE
jgi:hypothetical protein